MKKISLLLTLLISIKLFAQQTDVKPVGLKVGDKAPQIIALANNGKTINLEQLLQKGPVVLVFYRGQWCPYCSKALYNLNEELVAIQSKGATIIAVTPESAENIVKTVEKSKATFPIISDNNLAIMKNYQVNFAVTEKTLTKYKGYGIDLEKANGSNGANLPVPATYVIGTDSIIKYAFFDYDYSKRASISEIITNL
jgi:peroxiredoxin